MAVLVNPMFAVSFTVNEKVVSAPSIFAVTQAKPAMTTAFGPIQPPDIDGRYAPPLILFVG